MFLFGAFHSVATNAQSLISLMLQMYICSKVVHCSHTTLQTCGLSWFGCKAVRNTSKYIVDRLLFSLFIPSLSLHTIHTTVIQIRLFLHKQTQPTSKNTTDTQQTQASGSRPGSKPLTIKNAQAYITNQGQWLDWILLALGTLRWLGGNLSVCLLCCGWVRQKYCILANRSAAQKWWNIDRNLS